MVPKHMAAATVGVKPFSNRPVGARAHTMAVPCHGNNLIHPGHVRRKLIFFEHTSYTGFVGMMEAMP
jgi:hypothetical protein